jgi:hypothetical protein
LTPEPIGGNVLEVVTAILGYDVLAVHDEQAWFMSLGWQVREAQADADIASGRVARFQNGEDFLADLDN